MQIGQKIRSKVPFFLISTVTFRAPKLLWWDSEYEFTNFVSEKYEIWAVVASVYKA